MSRRERILSKLRAVVHDLSGIAAHDLDADVSFIDMGFDSLFLTQASLGFKRELGVRITFRQLFDEAPTLSALAEYIDAELPDDAVVEGSDPDSAAAAARSPTTGEAGAVVAPTIAELQGGLEGLPPLDGSDQATLRQILALQLQSTTALLAALTGGAAPGSVEDPARTSGPPPGAAGAEDPAARGAEEDPARAAAAHGPFRDIDRRPGDLTTEQRDFLDGVIERYVAKTPTSKALTAEHRDAFADPRAVAGFRQDWKELTYPIAVDRSKGSRMWDVDGNEYVDAVSGFGAIFFGHAPDFVVEAVERQLRTSLDYGPQSTVAGEIAELLCRVTGMDRAAFCNTGSEAVLAAMRMARTATGCDTIVTFNGDYHGIFDEVLVRRQDFGDTSRNVPVAPGIPRDASRHMVVLDYGAPGSLDRIRALAPDLAGVLVEPVQSRRPELQPREFLHDLRALCTELDVPLIFDEIITGFRVHPRGAQGWFDVDADIASYGKVVGGGMPIGIVAGRKQYMDALDGGTWRYGDDSFPEAGVTYFAGTFIRHPLALAAVHAVLRHLEEQGPDLQRRVNEVTTRMALELNDYFEGEGIPIHIAHFGSVFLPRFGGRPEFAPLFHRLLHLHGLHLWEGRPGFLTTEHTEADVDRIVDAFKRAAHEMVEGGMLERAEGPSEAAALSVPFTESQEEIWVATRMGTHASQAYNEPVRIDLEGRLDLVALRRAVRQLVRRHDAFRSTVDPRGEALVVHPEMKVDVSLEDLRGEEDPGVLLEERLRAEGAARFELEEGPLVRFRLFRLGEEHHALLMTVHHIACDGWSINIALRDLSALYSSAVTGRTPELEPAMTLAEYRAWYAERSEGEEAAETEAYWLERFEEIPPVVELPLDHARPADKTYAGARESLVMPAALGRRLREVATEHRCTLFTTAFATFNVLLHKLSGETDLVVGVPSAGQALLGENDLVAHCVHYLPIRSRLDADGSFAEYLDALRGVILDANSHSEITYGTLVKKLTLPRDRSRPPLLAAGFNLDPAMAGLDFHGLEWSYVPMPRRYCKLDLAVNVVENDGELLVEIDHNTDVIDADTALAWGRHWERLIEAIVENPAKPISALSVGAAPGGGAPGGGEDATVGPAASGGDGGTPSAAVSDATIHELIEEQVDRDPSAAAVADEYGAELTYGELEARSNRLAGLLRDAGVGRDRVVAVDLPRSVEMVVALVAIHKAGGAYLPLDDHMPEDRIRFMLDDAGVDVAVAVEERLARTGGRPGRVICLDRDAAEIAGCAADRPQPLATPDDLAYVIYTSGSTGRPKGVETTHRNAVNLLRGTDADAPLSPDDVMLAVTTLAFDQSVLQIFAPLAYGGKVVMAETRTVANGRKLAALMAETGTNLMKATPAVWRNLVESGWPGDPELRVFSGGEALPPDLAVWLARSCKAAWNHYGPTETTGHTTSWRIPEEETAVLIGRPLPGTRVYVLDDHMQPVPPGVLGEVWVGGAGVARGYRNRPELTAERFVPDPFGGAEGGRLYRTGDLARIRGDGDLEYVGRVDDQVKIRGFRIELGEVEALLREHPAIADAAARVLDAGTVDARLVAYVVPDGTVDAAEVPTSSEIRSYLRDRVPDYMVPGFIMELDALPTTTRGKVDRAALPNPFEEQASVSQESEPPASEAEKLVAEVWAEMLGVPSVGRHDNFFELGGHSLLAVRSVTRIEEETGAQIEPRTLFFQSLAQVAAAIGTVPPRELATSPE